jgi:hypothetical protein
MKSTFETTAQKRFNAWFTPAKKQYPSLAQVDKNWLMFCFYAGASFGSDEAGKIYKGIKL